MGQGINEFLGGTGKFKDIKGRGSYTFKFGNPGGTYGATVEYLENLEY